MPIIRTTTRVVVVTVGIGIVIASAPSDYDMLLTPLIRLVGWLFVLSVLVDSLLLYWLYARPKKDCFLAALFMNVLATPASVLSLWPAYWYYNQILYGQASGIRAPDKGTDLWYFHIILLLGVVIVISLLKLAILRVEFAKRIKIREIGILLSIQSLVVCVVLHELWWPCTRHIVF